MQDASRPERDSAVKLLPLVYRVPAQRGRVGERVQEPICSSNLRLPELWKDCHYGRTHLLRAIARNRCVMRRSLWRSHISSYTRLPSQVQLAPRDPLWVDTPKCNAKSGSPGKYRMCVAR